MTDDKQTGAPNSSPRPAGTLASAARQVREGYRAFTHWAFGGVPTRTFRELYWKESNSIGDSFDPELDDVLISESREDDSDYAEPWVDFTPKDRFGVALSGGGIRSATFNLGLLQALEDFGVLAHVDYLSTVSGGGYIGGFWTAWRTRRDGANSAHDTPRSPFVRDERFSEVPEVRHLREFSRFLLPRVGIAETEFWGIVMTVVGGLIPSLLTAIAVLSLAWCAWILLVGLLNATQLGGSVALGLAVLGFLIGAEAKWRASHKARPDRSELLPFLATALGASALASGAWYFAHSKDVGPLPQWRVVVESAAAAYGPALTIGGVALALLTVRILVARMLRGEKSVPRIIGFERASTRMLALAVGAAGAASLWVGAIYVSAHAKEWWHAAIGILTGSAATLFAWLKNWLLKPGVQTRGDLGPADCRERAACPPTLASRFTSWIQRVMPKALAWLAFLGLFLLVGIEISGSMRYAPEQALVVVLIWSGIAAAVIALTTWIFDPARGGLHEMYRSRITRCYLGASNPDAVRRRDGANREVNELPGDDVRLADIDSKDGGPVHLVCVAANDLSGDYLASLYRGARSAVLSGEGISIGNQWSNLEDLRFSSALTASAAAFNSEMGRVSMDLGPAVTFLMSALNLRLGLWVPHPDNKYRGKYTFPGRFFLYELFGRSRVNSRHLHLSDGGHFENLALYELIRRHCRYIVVSDCGADPDVAFDDLANAFRRVREDFGVEIDLDVSPLRPSKTGTIAQHAVIGEVHYDGYNGLDKGSIIYFKPGLTGDEPADVLQYKTRCPEFPNQTTMDQFYDEPQWESYRRLGEHAGRATFAFLDGPAFDEAHFVDQMFFRARRRWQPAPDQQDEHFLEMTARCADLEQEMIANGVQDLSREFFHEAVEVADLAAPLGGGSSIGPSDEEIRALSFMMRVLQLMEDTWISGEFERYWSHPLNEGWMAYFHRWVSTQSIRRWWPILAPIYSPEFREFVAGQLGLQTVRDKSDNSASGLASAADLVLKTNVDRATFESLPLWRRYLQTNPSATVDGKVIHTIELHLLNRTGATDAKGVPVGFALVREPQKRDESYAYWDANELYVPPWLIGSGAVGRLLESVVSYYRDFVGAQGQRAKILWVNFQPKASDLPNAQPASRRVLGPAARYMMVRDIAFYKSRGFEYDLPDPFDRTRVLLVLRLSPTASEAQSMSA